MLKSISYKILENFDLKMIRSNESQSEASMDREMSFLDRVENTIMTQLPEMDEDSRGSLFEAIRNIARDLPSNNFFTRTQLQGNNRSIPVVSNSPRLLIKYLNKGRCTISIKFRVISKTPIIKNSFLIDILDQESEEARIFFEESVCDKHKDTFIEGKVYIISDLEVYQPFKESQRRFTMNATNSTKITPCPEDDPLIALLPKHRLLQVSEIDDLLGGVVVDIVVQVKKLRPPKIRDVDGKKMLVRDIILKDSAGDEIWLTLWEDMIGRFRFPGRSNCAVQIS